MVLQTYVYKKQVRDASFLTQSVSLGFGIINYTISMSLW